MKRLIGRCLLASLALTIHAQPAEIGLKIEVHIYNYAGASKETLARAEQETVRIYRSLGVEMEWRNCPRTAEELAENSACELPAAPTRFIVRFLSDEMAHRFPLGDDIYGFALLPIGGGFGVLVNVFADRTQETRDGGLRRVILGHVMAHELGHLLLGEAGHPASSGIMHVPWQTKELERIKQGVMSFLPEQAERIRAQVFARMMADPPHTSLDSSSSVSTGPSSIREPASTLRLTLVIYDYAHVGPETLAAAESTVSEVFAHANVQLVWQDGFAYAAGRHGALNPAPEDPATLVVKLQPESEAVRYGVKSVCGGIGFESGAIVFVRSFDLRSTTSSATRIGYIMAHELGHILLGPNAHAIVGIMRGTLLPEDWEKAAQGTLGFTHSQNQQIRTWIAQRSRR